MSLLLSPKDLADGHEDVRLSFQVVDSVGTLAQPGWLRFQFDSLRPDAPRVRTHLQSTTQ